MSTTLEVLLEDQQIQGIIDAHEDVITEGSQVVMDFLDVIHEEVVSHPEKFLVPGDIAATHDGIKVFTEAAVASFLDQMTDELVSE